MKSYQLSPQGGSVLGGASPPPVQVLVTAPVHGPTLELLRQIQGIVVNVLPSALDPSPVPEDFQNAEVFFGGFIPQNFRSLHSLRWVQIESSGFTQLLPFKLGTRGITATNARGVFDVPIAEWNMAMMIALLRDLRGMMHHQDQGIWDRSPRFQGELRGKTVGFWGYGGIGRTTAPLAKAFGMKVHVLTRSGQSVRQDCYSTGGVGDLDGSVPDRFFRLEEKKEFLRSVDFLVIAMPLTSQTEGLIGEEELRSLSPRAFLLNPARGAIVQEKALLNALREKWIAGAALDTHYYYPMPPEHPLWRMENVIMTPHISGSTGSPYFLERLWDLFLQNLKCHLAGKRLLNILSVEDLG